MASGASFQVAVSLTVNAFALLYLAATVLKRMLVEVRRSTRQLVSHLTFEAEAVGRGARAVLQCLHLPFRRSLSVRHLVVS